MSGEKQPRVQFPRNKKGKLKIIPCVCGNPHPRDTMNGVRCSLCGKETSTPFWVIKHHKGNPRHDWNVKMTRLLWKHNRALFIQTFFKGENRE